MIYRYYGQAHMLTLVACLQPECDLQCGRICDEFVNARKFEIRAKSVRDLLRNQHKKKAPSSGKDGGEKIVQVWFIDSLID